jgi:hypothetical protein
MLMRLLLASRQTRPGDVRGNDRLPADAATSACARGTPPLARTR